MKELIMENKFETIVEIEVASLIIPKKNKKLQYFNTRLSVIVPSCIEYTNQKLGNV